LIAFWSQIAGFVLFAGVLVWAWQQWLSPGIARAAEQNNERIAVAEKHRDDMRLALEALHREVDVARHDGEMMKERARDLAAHEAERVVREAREASDRTIRNASAELARARAQARSRLRNELASRAVDVARTEAQKRIDGAVNAKLVQEFIASLERRGRN
jgi:F0F1-type ATP synthase membrane subunit b/b'